MLMCMAVCMRCVIRSAEVHALLARVSPVLLASLQHDPPQRQPPQSNLFLYMVHLVAGPCVEPRECCLQESMKATRLGFTAGTIDCDSLPAFERLLFRATRGNMFLRHSPVRAFTL